MSKHTPGPWKTLCNENRHGEFSFSIEAPEDQPEGTTIARVLVSNDDEANARLIAAAPELLDTLRECVGLLTFLQKEVGDYSPDGPYFNALALLARLDS